MSSALVVVNLLKSAASASRYYQTVLTYIPTLTIQLRKPCFILIIYKKQSKDYPLLTDKIKKEARLAGTVKLAAPEISLLKEVTVPCPHTSTGRLMNVSEKRNDPSCKQVTAHVTLSE